MVRPAIEGSPMTDLLPVAAQAAYLTAALRKSGAIGAAGVREAAVESSRNTILSRIIRLRLEYDGDAPAAPRQLVLKTNLSARASIGWIGRQEVAFYRDVAPLMPPYLVPLCFDAHWDEASGDWHLLLEDLTDSHVLATEW